VAHAAAERGIPIRVGVNAGSLPPPLQERVDRGDLDLAEALVESAQGHLSLLEAEGFRDLVVSLKAFDVPITVKAYRLMAQTSEYPLHLGITESGLPREGSIRSAVGLGILLAEGIGDTIRVSLGGPPEEEVRVAREILRSLDLRRGGVSLLCCPTCGRTQVDLLTVAQEVDRRLAPLDRQLRREGRDLQVAVMGCEVNGPGEAKGADVGIAAGRGVALLFRRGEILRRLPEAEMVDAIVAEAVRVAGQPPVS
jgi:(E)-4-hydroxy-3-methylbut-2-enyl-diphosphate synthase